MNAPHLPQGAIFVLMRQCLRFAYGGRFLRRCLLFRWLRLTAGGRFCVFGGVCVWRRAAVFCGVLRLPAAGRYLRCCGLRRAAVFLRRFAVGGGRCERFFVAAVFAFFAVFAFCGGRAFFAAFFAFFFCGLRRAGGRLFFFAKFAFAFWACVLRCLRLTAGGRFFTIQVPTFGSAVLFDKRCPGPPYSLIKNSYPNLPK